MHTDESTQRLSHFLYGQVAEFKKLSDRFDVLTEENSSIRKRLAAYEGKNESQAPKKALFTAGFLEGRIDD